MCVVFTDEVFLHHTLILLWELSCRLMLFLPWPICDCFYGDIFSRATTNLGSVFYRKGFSLHSQVNSGTRRFGIRSQKERSYISINCFIGICWVIYRRHVVLTQNVFSNWMTHARLAVWRYGPVSLRNITGRIACSWEVIFATWDSIDLTSSILPSLDVFAGICLSMSPLLVRSTNFKVMALSLDL